VVELVVTHPYSTQQELRKLGHRSRAVGSSASRGARRRCPESQGLRSAGQAQRTALLPSRDRAGGLRMRANFQFGGSPFFAGQNSTSAKLLTLASSVAWPVVWQKSLLYTERQTAKLAVGAAKLAAFP
jgi:hypothetical protein